MELQIIEELIQELNSRLKQVYIELEESKRRGTDSETLSLLSKENAYLNIKAWAFDKAKKMLNKEIGVINEKIENV